MTGPRLSALVVAHDEERQLADCLSCLGFADEIVVVLDRCQDRSRAIALRFTDRLIEGAWEREGPRRHAGIDVCRGEWIIEVDADERVTAELATEIRRVVETSSADWHLVPVDNYIGARLVRWGWGASFGRSAHAALFRKGVKRWGGERVHPAVSFAGRQGEMLSSHLLHYVDRDISEMLQRLDRYTTARAQDLRDRGNIGTFGRNLRRIATRFWKCYVGRRGYREGPYGFLIALCAALYPILSYLKARLETADPDPLPSAARARTLRRTMANVVMADDGIAFDGAMAEEQPLGGAETAFVALAEALARRGHRVSVHNHCCAALYHNGVCWAPLSGKLPDTCDLYIANRGHRVIGLVRKAERRLFWLHNPAGYLKKPRNLWRLAWYRPILVASGTYHAATIPPWLPCGRREIIPYGILDRFQQALAREPPPPRAIFTSNPLRGLDWLLDLWVARIAPTLPEAELHIYSGASVYGKPAVPLMEQVLSRADTLAAYGIRRFAPVGRERLAVALSDARVMLYRGDPGETFCLALAEAQAMGVPAVVKPLGSAAERVIDGKTGRVAKDDDEFAAAAIAALRDDGLWRRWHRTALAEQRGLSWDAVAARFEALMR
jgi:glycosyltransferase involved in cell wall biosynthesis